MTRRSGLRLRSCWASSAPPDAAGHDHIGQQQVHFSLAGLPYFQGFHAGFRLQNAIIIFLEHLGHEFAEHRLILHQQDGFPPAARDLERFILVVRLDGNRVQRGKENAEGGALADFAGHLHPALMLFRDAVNGGQPQAGAAADFLRGKERFKDARERFCVHAAAGVLDA